MTPRHETRKVSSVVVTCAKCGKDYETPEWPFCPHGLPIGAGLGVIDDQLEGGPRRFDVLTGEPYIATKSDLKREMEARGLVLYDRHDSAYYARQRRQHDEFVRDTGRQP